MNTHLKTFSMETQQYGAYFSGFQWTVFGCLTFKNKVSLQHGEAFVRNYMRRIGVELKARIPYIAVPESRYSGMGKSPVRLHFHFLAACPPRCEDNFLKFCQNVWLQMGGGDCKIDPYNSQQHGGYYLAKLASQPNYEWAADNLDRITYTGSTDLYSSIQSNQYVPSHAKGLSTLKTMVVTKENAYKIPGASTDVLQLIAKKTSVTSSPKKSTSAPQFGKLPVPTVPNLAFVWMKHVKTTTKSSVGKLSAMEYGQLKILRGKLGPAALGVLEYAVQNWSTFGAEVVLQAEYPAAPSIPDIGFLCKFRVVALKVAYQALLKKHHKTPCEWNLVDSYPILIENLQVLQ